MLARSVSGLGSCPCAGNPVRGAGVCWRVVGGPARKAPRKQVLPRASALHQHPAHPAAPRLTWLLPLCPLPHAHMKATTLAQPAAAPPPSAGVSTVCPSPAGQPRLAQSLELHLCRVLEAPRQGSDVSCGVLKEVAQRGAARPGNSLGWGHTWAAVGTSEAPRPRMDCLVIGFLVPVQICRGVADCFMELMKPCLAAPREPSRCLAMIRC